jgi:hypothetical protein
MSYHQSNQVPHNVQHRVETDDHGSFVVDLEFGISRGRYEVMALRVSAADPDRPVTAVAVRNLGLAGLIRDSRAAQVADAQTASTWAFSTLSRRNDGEYPGSGPDSTRDLTEDDLRAVAALYDEAYQRGISVQRHVAETLGVAIPTAARRISLARKAGFISPNINMTRSSNRSKQKES